MSYTKHELTFILFNNRSVEGVVKNFISNYQIDGFKLIKLEEKLDWCKKIYESDQKFVEIDTRELDATADDVRVEPIDLFNSQRHIFEAHENLSGVEYEYLKRRGITDKIIKQWKIGGLSNIKDGKVLEVINASCHPILKPILEDGLEGGGIIIPLFDNNRIANVAIRKLSDVGKLKYSLAVPDLPVWGLDDINPGDQIWICEGLFDMMALRKEGVKAASVSSAMWSGPQLYQLLQRQPSQINILADNDQVGKRTAKILQRFFNLSGVKSKTFLCPDSKDAAEHIFEKRKPISSIQEVEITKEMIQEEDQSFNFLKYLKNRTF
jgi:5S rRNA maturation endonuclease (ribonuclease M5)